MRILFCLKHKRINIIQFICDFRFSAVFFGGSGLFDEPHSVVINGQVFASPTLFLQFLSNIQIGNYITNIIILCDYKIKYLINPTGNLHQWGVILCNGRTMFSI